MDIVFIKNLKVDAIIGIHDWERQARQEIILDLEMASDIQRAAATEDIQHALDYSAVAQRVCEHVIGARFKLVETLVESVAELIIREYGVTWLSVACTKTQALNTASGVGVRIERGERN